MRVRPIHFVAELDAALSFYEALGLEAELFQPILPEASLSGRSAG